MAATVPAAHQECVAWMQPDTAVARTVVPAALEAMVATVRVALMEVMEASCKS